MEPSTAEHEEPHYPEAPHGWCAYSKEMHCGEECTAWTRTGCRRLLAESETATALKRLVAIFTMQFGITFSQVDAEVRHIDEMDLAGQGRFEEARAVTEGGPHAE